MHNLYTGLALWNLLVLGAFAVLSVLQARGPVIDGHSFQLAAVFSAVFCCIVHSVLVAHFIGSMKWIQQSGPTAGIEDTKPLRTAWIKGPAFPVLVCAMLTQVAVAILAGGAQSGAVPAWLPIVLALGNLPVNALGLKLAREEIRRTKARIDGVREQMEARIAQGQVQEAEADALLPESGRAGGKVFIFLGLNVWVLYLYMRFVLRHQHEPIWPYAVACAVLIVVGVRMLRQSWQQGRST